MVEYCDAVLVCGGNKKVNLVSFPVVLELAGEAVSLKALKDARNALCRVGQHGLQWDARGDGACLWELLDAVLDQRRNDLFVIRELAVVGLRTNN